MRGIGAITVCLYLIGFAGSALGTTYYVATTGSDSNPGTQAQPFLTIQHGANSAAPGDTVVVEDGVYSNPSCNSTCYENIITTSGTPGNWITIEAQNTWGAVLDGLSNTSGEAFNFRSTAAYIRVQGFEVKGFALAGFDSSTGASNIDIVHNYIHNIGNYCTDTGLGLDGIYISDSSNVTIERNLIHDIGRLSPGQNGCTPNTPYYESNDHCVYLGAYDGSPTGITIQNNVIYNCLHGWGLTFYGGSITNANVFNNTFGFPNTYEVGQILIYENLSSVNIENNLFYQPATSAIRVQQNYTYSNVSVRNNMTYPGTIEETFDSGGNVVSGPPSGITVSGNYDNTDPMIVSASTPDFSLSSNSPAIKAGLAIPSVTNDFLGNPRPQGSPYDIGAYQYVPAVSTQLTLAGPANSGFVGAPYNSSLTAAGGKTPYTYSIAGSLPPGLILNPMSGAITGVPTNMGTYNFTSQVKDSSGNIATSQDIITIGPVQPLSLTCPTVTTGQVSSLFSSPAPAVSGGIVPYTFSIAGALPPGLTLNPSTGAISGTPAAVGSFSLEVTDSTGAVAGACSYTITACLLSNLGPASGFSILGLSDAQVTVQSPIAGGGAIGIGSGGKLHIQGNTTVSNAVYSDPSAAIQLDGGSSITGARTTESFAAIQSAAIAESAAAAALTPTMTLQQIQSATTIIGNGGQNVIAIPNHVNLNNGANLTISGGPNDSFIFNIAQDLQLQNGASIVLNGVSPSQVLFNFLGNSNVQIQGNNNGVSNTAGIFLNLQGQITIQGGTHNSVFISGNQINIQQTQNGTLAVNPFTCPAPPPLSLSCPSSVGEVGTLYNSAFVPSGGTAPYMSFSIGAGSIGPLQLNPATGAITGTPTALPLNFTGKVTDSSGNPAANTATASCTIEIAPCLLSSLGGAGSFSILGLSGPGQNNPQINIQSAIGGTATIGVGPNVQLQVNGNFNLSNAIFEDPSATVKTGGGSSITGTQTRQSLVNVQSAALAASATLAALAPTQTFSQQIQDTTTITGNGGQNVISISNHVNLSNGQNLVISGSSIDTFIFNVEQGQDFHLQNGSSIILQGGVSPGQVLFNFLGNGSNVQIQSNNSGASNTAGIFLDPEGQINIQGGTHASVFVSGQIQIQNNPTVNAIVCAH